MVAASFGGVLGVTLLMPAAPLLARFATEFSSVGCFRLALLGLGRAPIVSRGSAVEGALPLLFGLWVASIGIDGAAGRARFTFGSVEPIGTSASSPP